MELRLSCTNQLMCSKVVLFKFLPHLPGANELITSHWILSSTSAEEKYVRYIFDVEKLQNFFGHFIAKKCAHFFINPFRFTME